MRLQGIVVKSYLGWSVLVQKLFPELHSYVEVCGSVTLRSYTKDPSMAIDSNDRRTETDTVHCRPNAKVFGALTSRKWFVSLTGDVPTRLRSDAQ